MSATPARMVTLVPLGLVLVVLGFVLGGLRMAGDGDVPETSVPAAARGEPESAASAHRAPTPEVEAPEVEAPEVLEAPEVEAPEVLEAPEVEADRPSPRRPKRRRHRTKSTSDARPSAQRSDGERGLLPPSWH